MLVGILIGQRTPGVTRAQARAFEERINQRYVDWIARAGWGYFGVYAIDGLVPGAFGEILTYDGDDLDEALRRDAENDRELPEDVSAFYAECRTLFWRRGRIGILWRVLDAPPPRDVPIRVIFTADSFELEPATDARAHHDVDVVAQDAPRVPESVAAGTTVVFHPFVPAPPPH